MLIPSCPWWLIIISIPVSGLLTLFLIRFVTPGMDLRSGEFLVIVRMSSQRGFSAQEISHAIITAGMRVHSELGPGLLESTYQACLRHELQNVGYLCEVQSASRLFTTG